MLKWHIFCLKCAITCHLAVWSYVQEYLLNFTVCLALHLTTLPIKYVVGGWTEERRIRTETCHLNLTRSKAEEKLPMLLHIPLAVWYDILLTYCLLRWNNFSVIITKTDFFPLLKNPKFQMHLQQIYFDILLQNPLE